jgi:hypothetical protein
MRRSTANQSANCFVRAHAKPSVRKPPQPWRDQEDLAPTCQDCFPRLKREASPFLTTRLNERLGPRGSAPYAVRVKKRFVYSLNVKACRSLSESSFRVLSDPSDIADKWPPQKSESSFRQTSKSQMGTRSLASQRGLQECRQVHRI